MTMNALYKNHVPVASASNFDVAKAPTCIKNPIRGVDMKKKISIKAIMITEASVTGRIDPHDEL